MYLYLCFFFGCGSKDSNLKDTSNPIIEIDADEDGVLAVDDCDDDDSALGALVEDSDCDGVLTLDDCDDDDASSTTVATDADCDGVLTLDDCDDDDSALGALVEDNDCDGLLDTEEFYLGSNGITVMCPLAQVGDSGMVNGVWYTKRSRSALNMLAAFNYADLETSCTSDITDMSYLFDVV